EEGADYDHLQEAQSRAGSAGWPRGPLVPASSEAQSATFKPAAPQVLVSSPGASLIQNTSSPRRRGSRRINKLDSRLRGNDELIRGALAYSGRYRCSTFSIS